MKKFVNDPKNFVPEMLHGLAVANADTLEYDPAYNLIYRKGADGEHKVKLVQGSGSGHEPAHVMVVGPGMLDAACPGDVFAAPPVDYVIETIKKINTGDGVLLLVNNYTGDKMAFDMAAEMAALEDIEVETVFVDDDVAVQDSLYTVGRRGVAGNFFVIKAAGAAAEAGKSLAEVAEIARKVNTVTRTMGVALTACTPPAKGEPLFELGPDDIEFGVGIHGEPGRSRVPLADANSIVGDMLSAIVPDLPFERGDRVALMVNGLGGTPVSELYLVYGIAHDWLADKGIEVTRSYVGEYCTSLDMAGASITLVRLDEDLDALFDAPAQIPIRVF